MSDIPIKEPREATDPDEPPAKPAKELIEVAHKERNPVTAKQRSKLRRELELAIARAEKAVADADEDSQEDEWGAAERRYLGSELKELSAERRTKAEAIARRSKKTIREIHDAEARAARMQLEELKTQLADMELNED